MRWTPTLLFAIPCLSLAGCALIDPTDPYAGMSRAGWPVDGQRLSGRVVTTRPVEEPLSLAEAVSVALANNPELAAAGYDVEAAGAGRDIALGAILPRVNVVGGFTRHLDDQRLAPARFNGERGVFSDDVLSSDLVVTMPLFTGGRRISEIKAAELLEASAEHRLARSRSELVFNVSSVFYSILAQRHVVESLEFSETALAEHLRRVEELIAAQKAARVDLLRTEVRIADIQQRLARERNVLAIQARVLANLLGLQDEQSEGVLVAGTLTADTEAAIDQAGGLAKAYSQRGDYLAARSALEAQAKRVDAARAGHWPTVAVQGAYGGRWAAGASDRPSGTSSFEDVGRVGVVVDIPVFEGGRIDARIRQERANLAAARERLRRLELQVRLDVETAALNIKSALQRVRATAKAIEQAEESLRIERQRYELAQGSITDVLDAQSALLDSQTNHYRALADHRTALAQFELATGEER